jgi:CubicO group peptidase (beta-lactamase class C family)
VLTAAFASFAVFGQQELPPPLRGGPPSDVPVAVQILRWHMLDSEVSSLMFRSMDTLFATRTVARSGPVWTLPRADRPLSFSYSWQGQTLAAEQVLERTYTNALLVMKDGRVVSEIYRNNTDERTRFIGWSMTKSITSVLIGCALAERRIDSLDTPITRYLPELSGGGYDGASIRDVMEMRSGVDYEERYDFENPGVAASNHIAALVRNTTRFADAARTLQRLALPASGSSTRPSTQRCSAGSSSA